VIVTVSPPPVGPEPGETLVIFGGGITIKLPGCVADCPSGFLTVTLTVPALSAGTTTVRLVAELKVTEDAGVAPKRTVAPFWKFCPVIATVVPPPTGPLDGVMPKIVGGGAVAGVTANE
jgi:hypothetical protein